MLILSPTVAKIGLQLAFVCSNFNRPKFSAFQTNVLHEKRVLRNIYLCCKHADSGLPQLENKNMLFIHMPNKEQLKEQF